LSEETWADVYSAPNVDTMSSNFMTKLIKKVVIRANQQNKIKLSIATQELICRVREFGEMIKTETDNNKKFELRKQFKSLKSYLGFCINNERRQFNDRKIIQ
jgi:hypothetical protein